ncbi:hypothetical protein RR46_01337 [Papilio xuthus]|uniref:Uncharacterized protein n=1 Tax=Papilio xuthus TaxID=66420 RepID=A0A0N1PHN7_PAPXU|nr:hypothetical protein RR46_01337 [Papilio xuthus]
MPGIVGCACVRVSRAAGRGALVR